jgi:hypothetical protein
VLQLSSNTSEYREIGIIQFIGERTLHKSKKIVISFYYTFLFLLPVVVDMVVGNVPLKIWRWPLYAEVSTANVFKV